MQTILKRIENTFVDYTEFTMYCIVLLLLFINFLVTSYMISNRSRKPNTMRGMNHRHTFGNILPLFFIIVKELYEKTTEKNMIVSITKNNINCESVIKKKRTIFKSSRGCV